MLTPEHSTWSSGRDRTLTDQLKDEPACRAVEKRLDEHNIRRTCLGGVSGCVMHVAEAGGAFSPWLPDTEVHPPQLAAPKGRVKRTAAPPPISNNGYSRRKDIEVGVDLSHPTSAHMERYRTVYTYRDRNPEITDDTSFTNETATHATAPATDHAHRIENWDSIRLAPQTTSPQNPSYPHQHQQLQHNQQQQYIVCQQIQQPPLQSQRHQYMSLLSGDQINRQTTPPRQHPRIVTPTNKPPPAPATNEFSAAYMYQKQCQRLQADPTSKLPVVTGNEKLNRLPSGNRRRLSEHRGQSGPGFVLKGRLQVVDFNHANVKNKPELEDHHKRNYKQNIQPEIALGVLPSLTVRKRVLTGKKAPYVPPKSCQKYRKLSPVNRGKQCAAVVREAKPEVVGADEELEPDREEKIARLKKYLLQLAEMENNEPKAGDNGEGACLNAGDVINYRIQPADLDLRSIRNTAANARIRP